MEDQDVYYPKLLKDNCPKCGQKLYTWFHVPTCEFPNIGTWIVECNSDTCDFKNEDEFINEQDLRKIFTVDTSVSADYSDATKIPKKSLNELITNKQIAGVFRDDDGNDMVITFSDSSCLLIRVIGFDYELLCKFFDRQEELHKSKHYLPESYKRFVSRKKIMNDRNGK